MFTTFNFRSYKDVQVVGGLDLSGTLNLCEIPNVNVGFTIEDMIHMSCLLYLGFSCFSISYPLRSPSCLRYVMTTPVGPSSWSVLDNFRLRRRNSYSYLFTFTRPMSHPFAVLGSERRHRFTLNEYLSCLPSLP